MATWAESIATVKDALSSKVTGTSGLALSELAPKRTDLENNIAREPEINIPHLDFDATGMLQSGCSWSVLVLGRGTRPGAASEALQALIFCWYRKTERSPTTRQEPSDMVWVSPGLLIRSFRFHTSARATEPRRPSLMSLLTSAKAKSLGYVPINPSQ